MKDYFETDDSYIERIYYELRGSLDQEYPDATIIVSTIGDIYVKIEGKEFKL